MLPPECVGVPGRLVLDKQTRKPKGTAFVEFEASTAAQKAAGASAKARCAPFVSQHGKSREHPTTWCCFQHIVLLALYVM